MLQIPIPQRSPSAADETAHTHHPVYIRAREHERFRQLEDSGEPIPIAFDNPLDEVAELLNAASLDLAAYYVSQGPPYYAASVLVLLQTIRDHVRPGPHPTWGAPQYRS